MLTVALQLDFKTQHFPSRNQIGQDMSEQKSNRIGYVRIEIKSDRLCPNRNQIGQVMSESKSNRFGSTTSTLIELFIKKIEEINCYIAIVLPSEFSNVFSDNSSKQIQIPKWPLLSHLQGELFEVFRGLREKNRSFE